MNFIDLTDASYDFKCQSSVDMCEYWDYDFSVERWGDKYCQNLSHLEVEQLKINCRRIIDAIEASQGE